MRFTLPLIAALMVPPHGQNLTLSQITTAAFTAAVTSAAMRQQSMPPRVIETKAKQEHPIINRLPASAIGPTEMPPSKSVSY